MPMTPQIKPALAWLQTVAPKLQLFSDSRAIATRGEEKAIFVAYPGDEADGRHYINQAIQAGAVAVMYEAAGFEWQDNWTVPHLAVPDLKNLAGLIAAAHYGQPDMGMFTVGVTGTNGKTSCSQWIASALSRQGSSAAVIGTLGIGVYRVGNCDRHAHTGYTTPDAVLLQRELAQLQAEGVTSLAIEASSIGLDQGRLNGMHFDVALFTNFTRDHLDYHGDMAAYEAAKLQLFEWPNLQHAVINIDDEMGLSLVRQYQQKLPLIGYTLNNVALDGIPTLAASAIRSSAAGTVFHIESPFGSARVKTHLVGNFNVSNALGVLGVLLAKGMTWNDAIGAIGSLEPVPGRMQKMGGRDAPMIVIDYAHTPDALEKALAALRQVASERKGELWCMFGCGGDRDPGKRPKMGKVAEAADHVIVTSDNPRSEEAQQIIEQVTSGMNIRPQTIEDRATAILQAVKQASNQDVILLAGKGHESYQEVKGTKYPFADADHAALALAVRATMRRDEA